MRSACYFTHSPYYTYTFLSHFISFFFHSTNFLVDVPVRDLFRFYNWFTQRCHHNATAGKIKNNLRTPTWSPLFFLRPEVWKHDDTLTPPGVYFIYDPNADVTEGVGDLKYLFQPVLEYIKCLMSGCPDMNISYDAFLTTCDPEKYPDRHQGHPLQVSGTTDRALTDNWILDTNGRSPPHPSPPLSPPKDPRLDVDMVCTGLCRWCWTAKLTYFR